MKFEKYFKKAILKNIWTADYSYFCVIKWKRQIWNGCYQRFYGGENQMKTTGCFMTVNKFQLTCSITFQLTLVYQISFHLEKAYWYMQNYSAKKIFMQKIPLIHSKSML